MFRLKANKEMSEKYHLHIYNSKNEQFPYYVREWDECYTEEEIKFYIKDYWMIANL